MAAYYALYRITPPGEADDAAFEKFLVDDILPAVDTGLTRVGAVKSLLLLREDDPSGDQYVLLVGTNGLNQATEVLIRKAREKLEAGGARISVSDLTEVRSWTRH